MADNTDYVRCPTCHAQWLLGRNAACACDNRDLWEWPPGPFQTAMSLSRGEDWPTRAGEKFRRIGWIDQRGRVWLTTDVPRPFDGGSFSPLLIALGDD